MFLMEEINGLDKLHSGMSCTVPLAMSAVLVSQPYKGPLNRNIRKTKLWIDWLMKMFWPRGSKNLILYFSLEQCFRIH